MDLSEMILWLKRNYLQDEKSFKAVIMALLNYNKKYQKDILALINQLYEDYAVNGVIDYATARKYIDKDALMAVQSLEDEMARQNDKYAKYIDELVKKKHVSRIEYTQALLITSFESMMQKSEKKITKTFVDNALKNMKKDFKYLSGKDLDLPEKQIEALAKEVSNLKTPYASPRVQFTYIRNAYYKYIETFIPQAFSRRLTKDQIYAELKQDAKKIRKRLNLILITMGNYQYNYIVQYCMKELDIKEYEYCAVLDDRTSKICRELNGQRFKISQAQTGVNFPPMHPNCRSFVVPII